MIHIDLLNSEDNKIQLTGDYQTVAYEIAKIIASYMIVYRFVETDRVEDMYSVICNMSDRLIPECAEEINNRGMITTLPTNMINKIKETLDGDTMP